jgi:flagellar hook assembly protein FlgD
VRARRSRTWADADCPITFAWNGKATNGKIVTDGQYTVAVSTTATVNGHPLFGRATRVVIVDHTAPVLSAVTGAGTTVYPYGKSPTTFTPHVMLNEKSTLVFTVSSSAGKVVRTITIAGRVGVNTMTWNGKNTAGARVPVGTYSWRLKATDAIGNVRTAGPYVVKVKR